MREKRRNRGKPCNLRELCDYVSRLMISISTLEWISSGGSRPVESRRRCGPNMVWWTGGKRRIDWTGVVLGLSFNLSNEDSDPESKICICIYT